MGAVGTAGTVGSARARRPRRTGPAASLLLVVAVALWVASIAVLPGDAGAQQRRVVVVGDSIILGAQAPLTAAFAQRGWAVTFDAAVSRSTGAGLQAIESHRPELTDSLVVSLGANDAGSPSAFRQRVQSILDTTAGVPHVYWVTVREVRDYYAPANQIVRELAAGRPNVTVLDWHGATVGATDLTSGDGLHLNGAGAGRMTQMVIDAVVAGSAMPAAAPALPPPVPDAPAPVADVPPVAPEPPPTTAAPTTSAAPDPASRADAQRGAAGAPPAAGDERAGADDGPAGEVTGERDRRGSPPRGGCCCCSPPAWRRVCGGPPIVAGAGAFVSARVSTRQCAPGLSQTTLAVGAERRYGRS